MTADDVTAAEHLPEAESTGSPWITAYLAPGDPFGSRDQLTPTQHGVVIGDEYTMVDNADGLLDFAHAVIDHLDPPTAEQITAAGLDPTAERGAYNWQAVALAALDLLAQRPATVSVAMTETRHFSWLGIGATPDEARNALMRAWDVHADATGADPGYLTRDSVNVVTGPLGTGFRDYDALPRP